MIIVVELNVNTIIIANYLINYPYGGIKSSKNYLLIAVFP